jgi:hypothetical protein
MTDQRNAAWLRAMPVVFVGIWSTGFIVARYGMPNSPPFTFLAWRYFFSISCFLIWIRLARVQWPQGRTQWLHLAVTGVLMHGGYLGGVWAAVKVGMGSGLSALIVGLQPVLTAVWLSSRGGHVSRRQWLGLLLGFLGLALVLARKLEGGVEVSGWSLAMATMDMIKLSGGEPANFLDVGGGANAQTVEAGFRIIMKDPNVKAILINIFGGIVRCDRVAAGVIEAYNKLGDIQIPIIVRLQGTNAEAAKELIVNSGLKVQSAILLSEAAQLVQDAVSAN